MIRSTRVLGLWLFSANAQPKEITNKEKILAGSLTPNRSKQYSLSRGYARYVLSELLGIPPLEIPLEALPGKPPQLPEGWGHISMSHCVDALLIGWSPWQIGVDIERSDRIIAAEKIMNRFFSKEEQAQISNSNLGNDIRHAVLQQWLIKEAAIKWQKGKISLDLNKWKYNHQNQIVTHLTLGHKANIHLVDIKPWSVAIAYEKDNHKSKPILCISKLK